MTLIQRLLYRVLPLLACLGVLAVLRWGELGVAGTGPQSTTVALGFLLMGAFIGGKVAAAVGLPRITGYLLIGLLAGPYASGLLTRDMLAAAKVLEGIAVALIALTAGGEIELAWLRKEARRLVTITALQILIVGALVFALVFLGRALFPFVPGDNTTMALIIAMVMAAIAISNSPTVTIAVIAENRAAGPLSRTVLGITVLVDLCVIILFAITVAIARDMLGAGTGESLAITLLRELGGSVLVGLLVGAGIHLFLRHLDEDTPVFILAVCFGISQLAQAFHLETLLIALTAGLLVKNLPGAHSGKLITSIERLSLPIYALFFAAAGTKVNVGALATVTLPALALIVVRGTGIWLGTRAGSRLSGAEPVVARYAWMGLISQAGVTLALAAILARAFPEWGQGIQTLIIAVIALHEIVGPIGFQYALRRAGEIGAADAPDPGDALPAPGLLGGNGR